MSPVDTTSPTRTRNQAEALKVDDWVWGRETIVWGFDPSHRYTFKILEPKRGRIGCLSLQYHLHKCESWLMLRGVAWALVVAEGQVCTRILRAGDIQNLTVGTIHRLAGISDDVRIAEPSTPDAHAADKNVPKDVIRLHCVHGRECVAPRTATEAAIVLRCSELTEEALACIDAGKLPPEYNHELLSRHGALSLPK